MGLSLGTATNEEPALTLELPSRYGSAFDRPQERRASGSVHSVQSQYVPPSNTRRAMLTLIVDESEWARARATLMTIAGSDIEVLRVVPMARTSDLRIHIGLESNAVDKTMSQIMRALNAAEFGPVTPAPASNTRPSLAVVQK
jgi:hypothetical protein